MSQASNPESTTVMRDFISKLKLRQSLAETEMTSSDNPTQTTVDQTATGATEEIAYPVQVYVYDISHGLARIYSQTILGISLDAIYHTSVVVYGKEYYFDQEGVVAGVPQFTRFGKPQQVLNKGNTYIPQEIFEEYVDSLKTELFAFGKYKLFENNCNHFTNNTLGFLNDKALDAHIMNIPDIVLNSPNGAIIQQLFSGGSFM
ncbi:hypothetical protein WICPIJ_008657 [Wickerhamomyces pijperi]|uniref:PPPDE domain-containing protein n=1 Tax=Wickerhamomyces pijperi TaxID=599730 RepID=A0A9P8PXR9_WICPI|nr:hypothetical protein WICPIJ_008657 [Wickerhamomyces pijperi]